MSVTAATVGTTILLALLTSSGRAQQVSPAGAKEVGHVERIAERKGRFIDVTSRAEIWRTIGALRSQVRRTAPLLDKDILRVRERVLIDLLFQQPELRTTVYLGSHHLSSVGSYEILQGSVGELTGLQLVVKQGVMVVEHARGGLLVVAGGIRTRIFGTTVLFVADSASGTATAYLDEGHISFPDYNMNETGKGRAWRLQPGQPPVELFLTAPDLRRWREEVQYTTRSVWHKTPFWQSSSFLIPAAAVVAGGVGCVMAGCLGGGDDGTAQGGVGITIPE